MWRAALLSAIVASSCSALAQDPLPYQQPTLGPASSSPAQAFGGPVLGTPVPGVVFPSDAPAKVTLPVELPRESNWYTRFEYFHWNERIHSVDFVNESGLLSTVGYARRNGSERCRLELFFGNVNYSGSSQSDDGDIPLKGTTGYIGLRGEYDLLIEPLWLPEQIFVLGIGSRFWMRDLKDGVDAEGYLVTGYQETWWTMYPYIGIESKPYRGDGIQLYGSARFGLTPLTWEHATVLDVTLHPRLGVLGEAEIGLRGARWSLAGTVEVMTWSHSGSRVIPSYSDDIMYAFQPTSQMFTAGVKAGFTF